VVLGWRLDLIILAVFSNLRFHDSMIEFENVVISASIELLDKLF